MAILILLVFAWIYRDAPLIWPVSGYFPQSHFSHLEVGMSLIIALVPNRWLVSSKIAFYIFLAISLIPFHTVFHLGIPQEVLSSLFVGAFNALFLAPLPVSLIASFIRRQNGELVTYA